MIKIKIKWKDTMIKWDKWKAFLLSNDDDDDDDDDDDYGR